MSKVRSTCKEIVTKAVHVSINLSEARDFLINEYEEPSDWGSFNCHYTGPMILDYVFALDALNFCFWPHANFDYQDLALGLKNFLINSPSSLSPSALAEFTLADIQQIFPPDFHDLPTRLSKIQELGSITIEKYNGSYKTLLETCNNSALKVIKI
jgi:Potential Queuosine, Q, salvage protein family